jgi:hypothetical protein
MLGGEGGLGGSLAALVPLLMRNLQDRARAPAPEPAGKAEAAAVAVEAVALPPQPVSYKLG